MVCVGGSVAVSSVLAGAPVYTAEAVRYGAACLLLVALARLTGRRVTWPRKTEWLWLSGIAVTGLVVFNLALVEGSRHAEPAVLGVAVACVPAVLALAGPLLEGSRPRAAAVAAALVVTAGAGLVQGLGRTDAIGVAWAVAVFGCEAAFTLLAIPVLGRHGPWGVSVHATWLATVMFGVLGAINEGPLAVTKLDRADWLAVGYLAVAVTAAAFVLWYSSVRRLGASRAGLLTGIAPVAAAVSGVLLGGRRPGRWSGPASRSSRPAWPSASGRGGPNQNVLPARRRSLAGLPGPGPRRPVRRGHHRRHRPGHGSPDHQGQATAGRRPGVRVSRNPGLAARLRPDGPEADSVPLRGRVAAAPVPHPGQPAAAAPAGRPGQRGLAGLRRPGRRPRRGPGRLAARGEVRVRPRGLPHVRRRGRAPRPRRGDLRRPGRAGARPPLDQPAERPVRGLARHQHRPDRGRGPARRRGHDHPRTHRNPGRRDRQNLDGHAPDRRPHPRRPPLHPGASMIPNDL